MLVFVNGHLGFAKLPFPKTSQALYSRILSKAKVCSLKI